MREATANGSETTGAEKSGSEAVWTRLAEDEERYVLELAAQRTLLERHFYLVIPAEGGGDLAESSLSGGAGLRLPHASGQRPSWLLPWSWLGRGRDRLPPGERALQ